VDLHHLLLASLLAHLQKSLGHDKDTG
jgi:hypothetical protein